MPAIKAHKTPVDRTGSWDGPKAVAAAPNEAATLKYMHAWYSGSDPDKKSSYKFPHHEGLNKPAVIAGVNNALARLAQAKIPDADRAGVEAHLRKHRRDAGFEEAMSEAEIAEAVKFLKTVNDLKGDEVKSLTEAVRLQEKANLGEWLEARIHMMFTDVADGMFGDGLMTREERIAFSSAIGEALAAFNASVRNNIPQVYQRRPFDGPPEGEVGVSESLVDLIESAVALQEKAVRSDGTAFIKIIQPGWGSSGYYPKEVLQRDGAKAFPKGTKMYWNHPTSMEEAERPEGDLNNLAAELVSDARWMENGPRGAGLYADAKVFEAFQPAVNDLAPHIGVSISARGKATHGKADGKEGVIVQEILASPFNHVDYVTMPGAGGEIVQLFEAARTVRTDKSKTTSGDVENNLVKEARMDELELKKLQEANATLQAKLDEVEANNARMQEALALRDARDMVREALSASTLPDVTKARLIESLSANPPMKDGSLDSATLKTRIEEAVKAEVKYLEQVVGAGRIRGLGESAANNDEDEAGTSKIEDALIESFKALGLSEAGAKIAARGRA